MKDFRPIWKDLAHRKAITRRDFIQHCILRAMFSKSDTEAVLKHLLYKAFRPRKLDSRPFRAIEETSVSVAPNKYYAPITWILQRPAEEILDEAEIKEFNNWADALRAHDKLIRHYSYFFTRQDISPEYQLVQTAHAALELGNMLKPEQVKGLYFTCCGVAGLDELHMIQDYLDNHSHEYVAFREPDIGNEITSIAVAPIAENKRGALCNFPLLSFYRTEPEVLIKSMIRPAEEQVQALIKGE